MPLCRVHLILACLCTLLLLPACSGGDKEQMLHQLEELERMNRADSVMRNDSLAEQLAEYFDSHGTPNERMRAHYILGRTYADMGEMPKALESYLKAVECADTKSLDCDFSKLCRIHAQCAAIYGTQVLPRQKMEELRLAEYFAYKAKDTLAGIECYAQTADAYNLLNMPESVTYIREKAAQMYIARGEERASAMTLGPAITSAIKIHDLERAKRFIETYEGHTGLFDSCGLISHGRELYYYTKGEYYLAVGEVDSAEYMFRLLAEKGKTLNEQIAANKGLREVYKLLNRTDSVALYAERGLLLTNSAYSISEAEYLQRLAASYNFNNYRLKAEKTRNEAKQARIMLYLLASLSAAILFAVLLGFSYYRRKRQLQLLQYRHDLAEMEKAQTMLINLHEEESKNSAQTISRLNEDIMELQERIKAFQGKIESTAIEKKLQEAEIVTHLKKLASSSPSQPASYDDMIQLKNLINETLPMFYTSLNTTEYTLRSIEYEVCMLIRVHFSPAEICRLINRSDSYVANLRRRILLKVFELEGTPKDLDKRILDIF